MNNVGEQNYGSSSAAQPAAVGLPPTEVTIRTMASDIQDLRESGGTMNKQAERIILFAGEKKENVASGISPLILWLLSAVVGIIVLFLIGYYILPLFFSR